MSSHPTAQSPPVSTRHWLPALLLAVAIVVPPGLNLVHYWLSNPLYGYGMWVPVLAIVLAYRRGFVPGSARNDGWTAFLLVAYFATLPVLRVLQIANPDWRLLDWALAGGAVAALLATVFRLGGPALLARWWFPIAFLLTAVPWSTSAENAFTSHAVRASTVAAAELLSLLGFPTIDDGRTLHTAAGPMGVSDDCSGIRGVQLAVMASLFWAGFFGLKIGRAVAMFLGGIATALLLNLLRVMVLAGAAVKTGQLATIDRLHDPAGTTAQIALMLALPALAWRLRRGMPADDAPDTAGEFSPAPQPGVSARLAGAAVLWCLVVEAAAESWFRAHETRGPVGVVSWAARRTEAIPGATELPMPDNVRQHYRYSDSLVLDWKDTRGADWRFFWLDFQKGAQSACTHNVHRPDACLPTQDFKHVRQFADLALTIDDAPLTMHHGLYQRGRQVLHLFHTTVQELPPGGERTRQDWTYEGRLRVAALGLRSQRSAMIHLVCEAPLQPLVAREAAADALRRLLTRAPAPE